MADDVTHRDERSGDLGPSGFVRTVSGCRYVRDSTEPPSVAVVTAVERLRDAGVAGTADAGDVLYDSVDPDALDSLFDGRYAGTATFTFGGCRVTVTSEREVLVTPLPDGGG